MNSHGNVALARSPSYIPDRKATVTAASGQIFSWPSTPTAYSHTPVAIHSRSHLAGGRDAADRRFQRLAKKWREETMLMSSLQDAFMHPAYQQIIGMGREALPLIFEELRARPAYWFWAIDSILGESVLPEDFNGNFEDALKKYLEWGESYAQM
jgi:hypothetical protein